MASGKIGNNVLNIARIMAGSVQFYKDVSLVIPSIIKGKKTNEILPVNRLNKICAKSLGTVLDG